MIENKRNRIIAEVNRDPFIARVVVEEFAPDRSGAEVTFGHYISPSIGQCFSASKSVNSKKPETNYILYGVRFVNDENYFRFLVDYIPILLKIDGQSCLAFFLESEYEPIQVGAELVGFGLENGAPVSCAAHPGLSFQFLDGIVVAVADAER